MNINLNNTNHQITIGKGSNGILNFGIGDSEKMLFSELQEALISKAADDEERETAMQFMQIPDKFLERAQVRIAKSRIFQHKMELAKAGDMNARSDIKDLFGQFGLARFLTQNMNDSNNFVTNLVSMNQRERLSFLRLEEYIVNGNRI